MPQSQNLVADAWQGRSPPLCPQGMTRTLTWDQGKVIQALLRTAIVFPPL